MAALTSEEVMTAADELIAAFAATDTDGYFGGFTPEATFVFHPEHTRLDDRAAYEQRWASWIAEAGTSCRVRAATDWCRLSVTPPCSRTPSTR